MGRTGGTSAGGLTERDKGWGQPCTELHSACSTAPSLRWVFFCLSFPESSGRGEDLCTTAPHPPMVCFLSGGVEPSETLNDRCYLICYRSSWKIVWKALAANGELEFQLTPVADRSFQAGNIWIISLSRKFCAKLSLQMTKHPGSG